MTTIPAEFRDFPADLAVDFGPYRAVVQRVIDGDTFWAQVSLGFDDYRMMSVRLDGVDTPEINRAVSVFAGKAAKQFVETLLPPGSPVLLFTRPDRDHFGRYVARVVMRDTRDLGEVLVETGHAVRVDVSGGR